MAVISQAFWTIAAEGLGSQVQKVGAQQEQEQKQGESHSFLPWQPKTPQIQRCLVGALHALT